MLGMLAKAYLEPVDGTLLDRVEFQFNPSTLKITRKIKWEEPEAEAAGKEVPARTFKDAGSRSINGLVIFLDNWEGPKLPPTPVPAFIKKLEKLTKPDPKTKRNKQGKPHAPYVMFGWGLETQFKAVITQLDVEYMMFNKDGTPSRAKVTLNLDEVPDEKGPQNPTSLGGAGRTSHVVTPGETLDLIAYVELGDARLWPELAELNQIDDPWSLRPGQRLVVGQPE